MAVGSHGDPPIDLRRRSAPQRAVGPCRRSKERFDSNLPIGAVEPTVTLAVQLDPKNPTSIRCDGCLYSCSEGAERCGSVKPVVVEDMERVAERLIARVKLPYLRCLPPACQARD